MLVLTIIGVIIVACFARFILPSLANAFCAILLIRHAYQSIPISTDLDFAMIIGSFPLFVGIGLVLDINRIDALCKGKIKYYQ
ncbi:MAG: hypothetical protein HZA36_02960 [Parcubacteria group bacterium]|nr:hypothetical protein [Parcubacteria group bacterium]